MTPLEKPVKRALTIGDKDYTLVIDPNGLKLTEKGHRRGVERLWKDLLNEGAGQGGASEGVGDSD